MDLETICAVADGVHNALHEERAMRLMYELRAMPAKVTKVYLGPPHGWVKIDKPTHLRPWVWPA